MAADLPEGLATAFRIDGGLGQWQVRQVGLIHDTFFASARGGRRYVVQRINTAVFTDPERLMANIQRVTAHARARAAADGYGDVSRRVLTLVSTEDGKPSWQDSGGCWWRAYELIEGAMSYDSAPGPGFAEAAAAAFGTFVRWLSDLPEPPLFETIPGFHDTPLRYLALDEALRSDSHRRVASVQADLAFAMARRERAGRLQEQIAAGALPLRTVHNDSKLNNVLFDLTTDEAICVVDLDTVMPGSVVYDFGDMVRSVANRAGEESGTADLPRLDLDLFDALTRGYLRGAQGMLNQTEIAAMPDAAWTITLELGVRYLTDYLRGDTYFRTERPGQNLDRARRQFRLLEDMEEKQARMRDIVAAISSRAGL